MGRQALIFDMRSIKSDQSLYMIALIRIRQPYWFNMKTLVPDNNIAFQTTCYLYRRHVINPYCDLYDNTTEYTLRVRCQLR